MESFSLKTRNHNFSGYQNEKGKRGRRKRTERMKEGKEEKEGWAVTRKGKVDRS